MGVITLHMVVSVPLVLFVQGIGYLVACLEQFDSLFSCVSINSSLESGFFIQNSRAVSPHFWQTPAFVYLMLRPCLVVPTEMAESAAREDTHAELISNNGQEKHVH
jgi:hypothetical protein